MISHFAKTYHYANSKLHYELLTFQHNDTNLEISSCSAIVSEDSKGERWKNDVYYLIIRIAVQI